jgi:predicted GIY-YIG superfamily endonuclease
MVKARFVAAFFGHKPGKAVFVGLYEVCGSHPMPRASIDKMPAQKELFKHGMNYGLPYGGQGIQLLFDLQPVDDLAKWGGKLIVNWPPPEIAFSRWASQNRFPVEAILDESILHGAIPDWRKLVFSWDELQVIPKEWRDVLAASRGVYFILDVSDGKGYVGMAENILERWLGYAKTGHGGNKLLRKRKPRNLLFTILERVSPDMEVRDLNERERTWKIRLHTFKYGLNDNL